MAPHKPTIAINTSGTWSISAFLMMAIVVGWLIVIIATGVSKYNRLLTVIDQENARLEATLIILKYQNGTIINTPTPTPLSAYLTKGAFVEGDQFIQPGKIPATVTTFNTSDLKIVTEGSINSDGGFFKQLANGTVVDCCTFNDGLCSSIWTGSTDTPSCSGAATQLSHEACGATLFPHQILRTSKLVPSIDETTTPPTTLSVEHDAAVASGRVAYDGGRQLPIRLTEYVIAFNQSRQYTLGDVAPCGYGLQGTSDSNPCFKGNVMYPVVVISIYRAVANSCSKPNPSANTNPPNLGQCSTTDTAYEKVCVPQKPPSAILAAQKNQSIFSTAGTGCGSWSNCASGTLGINPYASTNSQSACTSKGTRGQTGQIPGFGCNPSLVANTITSCGAIEEIKFTEAGSNPAYEDEEQICQNTQPINTTVADSTSADIFSHKRTYATTPKFPLVEDAVYEIRFGVTAMNFLHTFKPSTPSNQSTCSTFYMHVLENDACSIADGSGECEFFETLRSNVGGAIPSQTFFNRYTTGSPTMAFQVYPLCLAVPASDTEKGFDPGVFQYLDGDNPYVYDMSNLAQTHQLDGKILYNINMTQQQKWISQYHLDVTEWVGQCGLFLAATPMFLTRQQQNLLRSFGVPGNTHGYDPSNIDQCLAFNPNNPTSAPYTTQDCNLHGQCHPCNSNGNGACHNGGFFNFPANVANTISTENLFAARLGFNNGTLGYNHYCQTSSFTMLNAYIEVVVALPGRTPDLSGEETKKK